MLYRSTEKRCDSRNLICIFVGLLLLDKGSGFTFLSSRSEHQRYLHSVVCRDSILERGRPMRRKERSTCLGLSYATETNANLQETEDSTSAMATGYKIAGSFTGTLYEILGVSPTADFGEIKRAYRLLARQTHPDTMHQEDACDTVRDFTEIAAAWTILSDPIKRAQYDRSLTFSQDVKGLITSLLDEKLGQDMVQPQISSPSQTFTGSMEQLLSDLVTDVGEEGNSRETRYLPQSEFTTSAITIGVGSRKLNSVTYYDILGVSQQATRSEIKQAYLALARQTHPDSRPEDASDNGTNREFHEIAEAWHVLSDRKRRLQYDRNLLAESFTQDVENFVANVIDNVGPSVVSLMEGAVVPFVRELTARTLSAASRVINSEHYRTEEK